MAAIVNERSLSGLNRLKSFHKLKQREVFCPVSKIRVITTPLTVGDDLSLRTMVASPELYDQEIATLIYDHISFPTFSEKPSFDDFITNISSFDRRVLLYGIYSTTYDKIGEEDVKCPNCGNKHKDTIKSSEIIHEDSYTIWDKDESFTEYRLTVPIEICPDTDNSINSIEFVVKVPSIADHFNVLSLVSPEQIKINYEKTNSILSKTDELVLITEKMVIRSTVDGESIIEEIDEFDYIHTAIREYITSDITNTVIEKYNAEFDKFSPKFEKRYQCKKCHFKHNVNIQLELSLFRNFFGF